MEAVTNPQTGLRTMQQVRKTRQEVQPILNAEEAGQLKGQDWQPAPDHFKQYGNFVLNLNGRRFFCAVNPNPPEPTATLIDNLEGIAPITKAKLKAAGLTTAGELIAKKDEELLAIEGIGQTSLESIRKACEGL